MPHLKTGHELSLSELYVNLLEFIEKIILIL